ncbi:hypothetical protein AB833_11225 [Chromatiales bacterium (ex Bugula neritina AB1)]|nr:hypothetical protein AB833_11225 [Chromatiales bacterium (ex Bugula neritina AB1)]
MSVEINKVTVIGAGTMGAGIAALCATAGCQVWLLDMKTEMATASIERLSGGKRPVITQQQAALITAGSLEDDFSTIADSDWICEAVVEDLKIKRDLFSRIEKVRSDGSVVTTNTSGIPLKDIVADMPERLRRDIAVTHFFNPVHIMKLVELVPGADTQQQVMDRLTNFLSGPLGKGVVHAKDTVNFIGNRIGCFWMLAGLHKAAKAQGISMETIDALMSRPVGLPPTGLYGLIDLIGLDVMDFVAKNLDKNLPADDIGRQFLELPDTESVMLGNGQLGRKTGGGFYKLVKAEDGSKSMEVYDLQARQWRPMNAVELESAHQDIKTLVFANDAEGKFSWDLMSSTLEYASSLVPEISNDIVNVDRAMAWGFNWALGPFKLIDAIGAQAFAEKLQSEGRELSGMLKVLIENGHSSFYRNDESEFLTVSGTYEKVQG